MKFSAPKLVRAYLFLYYQPTDVRQLTFDIEAVLNKELPGRYTPALVLPTSEIDPNTPSVIFTSIHGHSMLFFSKTNLSLQVNFSQDWQIDFDRCKGYVKDRIAPLFKIIQSIDKFKPTYSGITLFVELKSEGSIRDISLYLLSKVCHKETDVEDIYSVEFKKTSVRDGLYFLNVSQSVYDKRNIINPLQIYDKMPDRDIYEAGVQIVCDLNDRYAFNNIEDYTTNESSLQKALDLAFSSIKKEITKIR